MSANNKSEFDAFVVVGTIVVFALPLTLLIPGFSVWDIVPKVRVTRCHIVSQHVSWPQLNAIVITLLFIFFCLHLEIRKRKLDDLVESVLTVCHEADTTMEVERERQTAAMHVCVEMLDASAEHYENLTLLSDELRRRAKKQHPPVIEPSSTDMFQ